MSGFVGFPGCEVREKLDHPVIDMDAHVIEAPFALDDFILQVGGPSALKASQDMMKGALDVIANPDRPRPVMGSRFNRYAWWAAPSGTQSGDRAMVMLPRYFKARMDRAGLDFAHLITTEGLINLVIKDDELRRVRCRANNMLLAEMCKDVGDRIRPVAQIPMNTPEEAIDELEFAVKQLGFKSAIISTEVRRVFPEVAKEAPHLAAYAEQVVSVAMDPLHDYDPFWQRCIDLGIAPMGHTSGNGARGRQSPSSFVNNHLGAFAAGAEWFVRSMFLGGVMHRFPKLHIAVLECGASWAMALINDIVEHYEKRNPQNLLKNLDPRKLDVKLMADMFERYGDPRLTRERYLANPHHPLLSDPEHFPAELDEFKRSGMTEVHDLKHLICDRVFFGCEADDRMTAVAFNRKLNPVGSKLNVMFGSDIGHWDVIDAESILSEAWSLVDAGLVGMDDFRDLTCMNAVRLNTAMNPNYFDGTAVAAYVDQVVAAGQTSVRKAAVVA